MKTILQVIESNSFHKPYWNRTVYSGICDFCKNCFYTLRSNGSGKNRFCNSECRYKFLSMKMLKNGCIENGYRRFEIRGRHIFEHRLVMEKFIGRKLRKSECIHHIDGDRLNNSIENLEIISRSQHTSFHRINKEGADARKSR